jgi:hypothetical protein
VVASRLIPGKRHQSLTTLCLAFYQASQWRTPRFGYPKKPDVAAAISSEEAIPYMGIDLDDRGVPTRLVASLKTM